MYKKHKNRIGLNVNNTTKRPASALNVIDENATIKIAKHKEGDNRPTADGNSDVENAGSEEKIPFSQEYTQRYLSQRSIVASLARTQSRHNSSSQRPPNSYCELILIRSGVQLDEGETFVLSCDHVAFVSKFRELLVRGTNFTDNVQTFITGLADCLATRSQMAQKLLTGCTISAQGEQCSVYQSQDSLFANFFAIDFLQEPVLNILLDRIALAAKANSPQLTKGNIPLLPLLLTQLRYLSLSHSAIIFDRIKKIFVDAQEHAKWEITAQAEFILSSEEHDSFAQLLVEQLVDNKDFFQTATIQVLVSLNLSIRLQEKLRSKILNYIKNEEYSITLLPLLVKFLLKAVEYDQSETNLFQLVVTLREILIDSCTRESNTTMATTSGAINSQTELELFGQIQQVLIRSRKLYSLWQKCIAGLTDDFHAVDFIILLLLLRIREDNTPYLSNILRRHIKQDTIRVDILEKASSTFAHVLEEHTTMLMQLLHDFLRERTKVIADFARASYAILFRLCDGVQKTILKQLLELTCDKSAQNMIGAALQMLRELQRRYPREFQNWGTLLMPLLDRLHEMSLPQTRLVMELVCAIAFPPPQLPECTALQEQIDMLVRKQLINRLKVVKKQGIIGSVQLIDNIARIEDTGVNTAEAADELLNVTFNTVSDLPDGRGKIAANHILRLQSSTQNCSESLALFYDELATVCQRSPHNCQNAIGEAYYDKPFLAWLCEMTTYNFQNNYICEQAPVEKVDGFELSYQKCINTLLDTTTETEEPMTEVLSVAINIAGMVLAPPSDDNSIAVLTPLFRLVRVLHSLRSAGSLVQINALLGCAIVLPSQFAATDEATLDAFFIDSEETNRERLLDIQFHCANWLREVISSFVTQREPMIRHKVLQRLSELIRVETTIRRWLPRVPIKYTAPRCEYIVDNGPSSTISGGGTGGGRGRPPAPGKRGQAKTNQRQQQPTIQTEDSLANDATNFGNATIAHLAIAGAGGNNARKAIGFEELYGSRELYRPMDTNVMLLMHEPLSLTYPLPESMEGDAIGLNELRFMLVDLVTKLEVLTGNGAQLNSTQCVRQPQDFMEDLGKFVPVIVRNMDKISVSLEEHLKRVKGAHGHADLFNEECSLLKVCFGLSVRLLAAYLSWSEFHTGAKADLLQQVLLGILQKTSSEINVDAAVKAFEKCLKYEKVIMDLRTAVHLHRLLIILRRHSVERQTGTVDNGGGKQKTLAKQLRVLCKTLLLRKWYSYDGQIARGAVCNCHLDELVKGFLQGSNLRRQGEILRAILEEAEILGGGGKNNSLRSFPNIKKANFPLLFRGLCEVLIKALHEEVLQIPGWQSQHRAANNSDRLAVWEQSCELLNMLLNIVRALDIPRNFDLFLKHSHLYLKLILQHAFPIFEEHLRQTPQRVSDLLKSLQVTTRFLHNLCVHSKALRKINICNQIPMVRETVEHFLYRVKALLAANKCSSVFWMGQLKNKDLHGDEVISMTSTWSNASNNGDDEDEHIPEDDESVDETIMLDDNNSSPTRTERRSGLHSNNVSADRSGSSSSRSKCF